MNHYDVIFTKHLMELKSMSLTGNIVSLLFNDCCGECDGVEWNQLPNQIKEPVMSERNPLKTDEELARALDKLFDEIPPPETSEEVDAVLREAGFDPHEVATRMEALAERALANSPLNWRNRDQEMEEARTQLGRPSSIPRL